MGTQECLVITRKDQLSVVNYDLLPDTDTRKLVNACYRVVTFCD